MADIEDLAEYYKNLLIIQYHDQPNAQATIELLAREALADGIYFDVRDGFNIDTAVGVQLDTIGKYVGVTRYYKGQNFDGYFAFTPYDEITPDAGKRGFSDYSNFTTKEGKFLTYDSVIGVGLRLNDDEYRFILKLKIIQNNSNHSHKSIDDSMFAFFGSTVRADSEGNMAMFYFAPFEQSQILQVAIQKDLLPRPEGVRLTYIILVTTTFFAFSTYTGAPEFGTGFSDYADFDTKEGEMLTYGKLIDG